MSAELAVPSFFSDGMVLQQKSGAKIWGWEDEGAKVTVAFGGKKESAKADEEGRWEVTLSGLEASGEGKELRISSGKEELVIQDVVVGEVWVASGQSNMEWKIARSGGAKKVIAESKDPLLRMYLTPNIAKAEPQIDFPGEWASASPKAAGAMSAVGYFFAKRLREELNVPVGVIECAWGGRPVESFVSEEALHTLAEAKGVLEKKEQAIAQWDPALAKEKFEKDLVRWEKKKKGRRPQMPEAPVKNSRMASTIYQGMIAPLVGYGARGVIWYQGESNAQNETAHAYEELLGCLAADWRERWGREMSFYYVQLANYREATTEPGVEDGWVTVQDEMRRALTSIPRSGMAVINDIGEADDIHPKNKHDVGERLARWALAKDYGNEEIVVSGPLFKKAKRKGKKMVVSFDYNGGLQSRDGEALQRFEIKAEGGNWVWAQAKINKEGQVIVWSDEVEQPAEVRYAWASNPEGANLVNGAGLPASCFTSEETQ